MELTYFVFKKFGLATFKRKFISLSRTTIHILLVELTTLMAVQKALMIRNLVPQRWCSNCSNVYRLHVVVLQVASSYSALCLGT